MSDRPEPGGGRPPEDDDVQESLVRAIDALEEMLAKRDRLGARGRETPPADAAVTETTGEPGRGEQYTIPLLNDVVVPGFEAEPDPAVPAPMPPLVTAPDMELYRRLFERLASEIEIIIQTGVEEALQSARETVRKRITDHIEIVLPEILEEIAHLNSRKDP